MTTAMPRTTPRKNEFIFYRRISQMSRSIQCVYRSQNLFKLKMQCQRTIPNELRKISFCRSRSPKYARLSHFTLFCRGRLRNVQRFITHAHSCRPGLLKVPINTNQTVCALSIIFYQKQFVKKVISSREFTIVRFSLFETFVVM